MQRTLRVRDRGRTRFRPAARVSQSRNAKSAAQLRPPPVAATAPAPVAAVARRRDVGASSASWRWWSRRPAIRGTCSTSIWIWKPTSASTPSSRRRCSPPSARPTTSRATPNVKLRDFPTLAHVIRFVYDRRPDLAGVAAHAGSGSRRRPARSDAAVREDRILDLVVEKTGYPQGHAGSRPGSRSRSRQSIP